MSGPNNRELILVVLASIWLLAIGTLDFLIEVVSPGEDIVDGITVTTVAFIAYRVGKQSNP